MTTYVPQYRSLLSDSCSFATTQEPTQGWRVYGPQVPRTPHMFPVPLPGEFDLTSGTDIPGLRRVGNYPLNIFPDLTLGRKEGLQTVELTTPIHVHATDAHIGMITTVPCGQKISSSDIVLLLHSTAASQPGFDQTFSYLSAEMVGKVKDAFYRRKATDQQNIRNDAWSRFISGKLDVNGPLGIDVLLGNDEIWGFESRSLGGYSVVHLAGGCM